MKKEEQIRRLKKYASKYIDTDLLDWESLVDSELSYQENKEIIKEFIKTLANSENAIETNMEEFKSREKSIRHEKEMQEKYELEMLRKEEEYTKRQLNKAIKEILNNKDNKLNDYFEEMRKYIKAVIKSKGYLNSLFIISEAGLGKTTILLSTLKELKKDYVYINNYATIVEFVNFLYENKDKIIVLDDFETLFKMGDRMINILKGALWGYGKNNTRVISYLTTDKRLKAPQQFEFTGKIFFLLNRKPNKNDELINALLSRSLVYELKFDYPTLMNLFAEFIKLPYKNLTYEQRKEIFEYIKENADETTENLNFRTIIKLYDLYIQDKELWKNSNILNKNEKLVLLKKLISECKTIREAQERFREQTGLGRTTFFMLKRKLSSISSK